MKKNPLPLFAILILLAACGTPGNGSEFLVPSADTPVEYYAVLAEKDSYADVDMTGLPVNYIDIKRIRTALEESGWPAEQIHEVREFDQASLKKELDWLEQTADANDLVFVYITGHGNYLRHNLRWKGFFPAEWAQIPSYRRVLLLDSCQAAEFTAALKDDPLPYLALAAVDKNEYGWKGLESEGLPIVGGVFTFYFVEALGERQSDLNGDGRVSIQEAALRAEEKQRSYMQEIVLVVPEFLAMYYDLGVRPERDRNFPDVIIQDTIGQDLFLDVEGK